MLLASMLGTSATACEKGDSPVEEFALWPKTFELCDMKGGDEVSACVGMWVGPFVQTAENVVLISVSVLAQLPTDTVSDIDAAAEGPADTPLNPPHHQITDATDLAVTSHGPKLQRQELYCKQFDVLVGLVTMKMASWRRGQASKWFATEKPYVFQRFLDAETSLAKKDVFRCFTLCYKFLNAQKVEEAGVS
jgi:hypothetical protein